MRCGAPVRYKGAIVPYKGTAPIKAVMISSADEELVAYTYSLRPCAFERNVGDVLLYLFGMEHFLNRCGIALPGHPGNSSLINAPTPNPTTTLSQWLTAEQIRTLVLAGRIRYEKDLDGSIRIFLVAPAIITWAGQHGYWREASVEDCQKVA